MVVLQVISLLTIKFNIFLNIFQISFRNFSIKKYELGCSSFIVYPFRWLIIHRDFSLLRELPEYPSPTLYQDLLYTYSL